MAPPVHEEKKPPAPAPRDKKTPASAGPTVTDELSKWEPEFAEWEGDQEQDQSEESAELKQALGWRAGPMPVSLHATEPTVLVVPMDARYEEVAEAVSGSAGGRTDWFEFIPPVLSPLPPDEKSKCVQVIDPSKVGASVVGQVRDRLEPLVSLDIDWTVARLKPHSPTAGPIVNRALIWSQRSGWRDTTGRSYFDRYLDGLSRQILTEPKWYTATLTSESKTALDWLLSDLGSQAEPIKKAITLRTTRDVGYVNPDKRPILEKGDVIGRMFFKDAASVQLAVDHHIGGEASFSLATIRAQNAPQELMRVVMPRPKAAAQPGDAWRQNFYDAYTVTAGIPLGPVGPEVRFLFFYPGAVILWRFNEITRKGDSDEEILRTDLGWRALHDATPDYPQWLYGLDYDVLQTFTATDRMKAFKTITDGRGATEYAGVLFLARLVTATPNAEFPALEKELVRTNMVRKLATADVHVMGRAALGHAFTMKALAVHPSSLSEITDEATFTIGKSGGWASRTTRWVEVDIDEAPTRAVAESDWPEGQPVKVGEEPAAPDEATHETVTSTIHFTPTSRKRSMKYFYKANVGPKEQGPRSRAYHPAELIMVEIEGHENQSRIMTAFELAMFRGDTDEWSAMDIINLVATYIGIAGVVRGIARAAIGAAARESLQVAATAGTTLATEAGKKALISAATNAAMIGALSFVDTSRFELEKTAIGRTFLAIFDVATMAFAARGLYQLWKSGMLQKLIAKGGELLRYLGPAAKQELREAVDIWEALKMAFNRKPAKAPGLEPAPAGGPRGAAPEINPTEDPGFLTAYRQARAELGAKRAIEALTSRGLPEARAASVLEELRQMAASDGKLAKAFSAVARKAAKLDPAEIDDFLAAVKRLLGDRAGRPQAIAGFLEAAARSDKPLKFLEQAQILAGRPGIPDDVIAVLARKAARGTVDLEFLNKLKMSDELLNSLGGDPRTPWRLYQLHAERPFSLKALATRGFLESRIRGAAGELIAQRMINEILGGRYRISGQQVRAGGSILDYELTPTGRGGKVRLLEVKAWKKATWDEVANALKKRLSKKALTDDEKQLLQMLDHLTGQLRNAHQGTGGRAPYLLLTEDLEVAVRGMLQGYWGRQGIPVNFARYTEASLAGAIDEIFKAFGII